MNPRYASPGQECHNNAVKPDVVTKRMNWRNAYFLVST